MESTCIAFREIPHTTKLFTSFVDDFPIVASYYGHPPTPAGIDAAAREIHYEAAMRRSVGEILREQNLRYSSGNQLDAATSRNLDRFASGAVAIVTGQQVGLFSGPAFSFYKALSAVRCADETSRRGIDAVPVFWLATEDHDLAEVNHVFWNTRNGLARHELPAKPEDAGQHVGEVLLGDAIRSLVSTTADSIEGPFAEDVARALRDSYTPGETYGSAFAKLMARLLAGRGIIFIDPLDARFHRLAAPVYRRALNESDDLRDALLARSQELDAAGLHAQVKVTRDTTLLFCKVRGRREALRSHDGNLSAGELKFTRDALAAAIEKSPEDFTPSALLRPIVQDTLLPTAAYIGGPAEVAYMAQAQVTYRKILGRMPAILPRASFTVVEPPIARFLAQYGFETRHLVCAPQHIRAKMEQKTLPEALTAQFDATEQSLRELLKGYEEPLAKLDPTLIEVLRSAEGKILHQFGQLKSKAGRAESFRSGVLDRHERILLDSLYPNGGLQERSLCLLPILAASGRELLDEIERLSSIDTSAARKSCVYQHQVLVL